jgi:GTPase SAR1 family protein
LIVGKENIGKTAIVNRITNEWGFGDLMKSTIVGTGRRIPTDGIDMREWYPHKELNETVIQLWDFAGQQTYYITHQFFLDSSDINILVFKLTEELDHKSITFWFNCIQAKAPGSTIMFVGTFLDQMKSIIIEVTKKSDELNNLLNELQKSISESQKLIIYYFDWNEKKISFCPVSCTKNIGIDELCKQYVILKLIIN